jgi:hypothetical protein
MLPALTVNGVIYSHIKMGAYNGDQFLEWLEGLLQVMNPFPAPNSVLVLDNCRIHHVEGVEELCDERSVSSLPLFSFQITERLCEGVSSSFIFHPTLQILILSKNAFRQSNTLFVGVGMNSEISLRPEILMTPTFFCTNY